MVTGVDVVIVAHEAGELLGEAVASAAEQAGGEHVWVVDAGGTDGSVDAVCARIAGVHVIRTANLGFAAGNNRAIAETEGECVLLLNPDAVLLPGALRALTGAKAAHPRAGIVGPQMLNFDGSVQANSFGRFPGLGSAAALRLWRVAQRLRGNSRLSPVAPGDTAHVDWVTGAAMLVRREAIEAVGPLDDCYFLYYEDVDWCHRMRVGGWDVLIEPRALVAHALGGSAGTGVVAQQAYRDSFRRYCDVYGLWGLRAASEAALAARRALGGRG